MKNIPGTCIDILISRSTDRRLSIFHLFTTSAASAWATSSSSSATRWSRATCARTVSSFGFGTSTACWCHRRLCDLGFELVIVNIKIAMERCHNIWINLPSWRCVQSYSLYLWLSEVMTAITVLGGPVSQATIGQKRTMIQGVYRWYALVGIRVKQAS